MQFRAIWSNLKHFDSLAALIGRFHGDARMIYAKQGNFTREALVRALEQELSMGIAQY